MKENELPGRISGTNMQSLMGMERISGEVATATKHIWWLTYANKSEKRSKRNGQEARSDQEVILKLLTYIHNPKSSSLPGLRQKETITATHAVDAF